MDLSLFVVACLGQGEVTAWQRGLWSCLRYQGIPILVASARKDWLAWKKVFETGDRMGRLGDIF